MHEEYSLGGILHVSGLPVVCDVHAAHASLAPCAAADDLVIGPLSMMIHPSVCRGHVRSGIPHETNVSRNAAHSTTARWRYASPDVSLHPLQLGRAFLSRRPEPHRAENK